MSLYKEWLNNGELSEDAYHTFWENYLVKEQAVYDTLLTHNTSEIKGTLSELAQKYEMDNVTFVGFLDGINTSLHAALDMENLTESSPLNLSIDWEKLYYNMLDAKAEWLYTLSAWDLILSVEKRKEIKKEYNKTRTVVKDVKINRNDPCPCGSGKKYKKCCISN